MIKANHNSLRSSALAGGAILLVACQASGHSTNVPSTTSAAPSSDGGSAPGLQAILSPRLTVLDLTTSDASIVEPTRLIFPRGYTNLLRRRPGDILAASAGSRAIYLRKVISIAEQGDMIVIETTQANIAEAVLQGELKAQVDLLTGQRIGGDALMVTPQIDVAENPLAAGDVGGLIGGKLDLTKQIIDSTCLGSVECSIGGGGSLSLQFQAGHVTFSPNLDIGMQLGGAGLSDLHFNVTGALDAGLTVQATLQGKLFGRIEKTVWQSPPKIWTFAIGELPVVIEGYVKVNIGAEVDFQASPNMNMVGDGTVASTFLAGGRWDGTRWNPVTSISNVFGGKGVTFKTPPAKAYVKPYIAIKPTILFYAVAGPAITLRPYAQFDVNILPTPASWDFLAGVDASLRGTLEPLGLFKVADVSLKLADFPFVLGRGTFGGTSPPGSDPCARAAQNGPYCGRSRENGFAGGDVNSIYYCADGRTDHRTPCGAGCTVAPPGQSDQCSGADPCAGVSSADDGAFCSSSNQLGFNPTTADSDTLYMCKGGVTQNKLPCSNGCHIAGADQPDSCYNSPATNPCSNVSRANNGDYCGASKQNGFGGADNKIVFTCTDQRVSNTKPCFFGCFVAPVGQADGCNSADPCSKVTAANDGRYCNYSTQFGFDPTKAADDTLYLCQGGKTVTATFCDSGCRVAAAGQPDACYSKDPCSGVSAANNGDYCGTSNQLGFAGGDRNTVFTCMNGRTTKKKTCFDGCVVAPAGKPDACESLDPCAKVSAANDGAYCNYSTQNGFDASKAGDDTLYQCAGGITLKSTFCDSGCVVLPNGQPDACGTLDPCGHVAAVDNGWYCGSSRQFGFQGADPQTVYMCANGKTARSKPCVYGCFVAPAGQSDDCESTDPCARVTAANNGLYCNYSTQNGFDPSKGADDTLYSCQNGIAIKADFCDNGCHVASVGKNDSCQ